MLRVALTMRILEAVGYTDNRDAISQDWINYLEKNDLLPILIPNGLQNPVDYFIKMSCDTLILTNGEDIVWGNTREQTESLLLQHALDHKIPVLGVCRGLQFINLFFNGSLSKTKNHVNIQHDLTITQQTMRNIFSTEQFQTNSYHNFAVKKMDLASPLIPWAVQDDIIEAF
jgi:N5-(cytidine 5'-diphosphoramidyl)-L-glutamine hydrolase